jgi:hypothetical protein
MRGALARVLKAESLIYGGVDGFVNTVQTG